MYDYCENAFGDIPEWQRYGNLFSTMFWADVAALKEANPEAYERVRGLIQQTVAVLTANR